MKLPKPYVVPTFKERLLLAYSSLKTKAYDKKYTIEEHLEDIRAGIY